MTDIIQMSKGGTKFYPQTHVQAVLGLNPVGTNLAIGTNQEYVMGFGMPNTSWKDGYAYQKLPTNATGEILPQDPHSFWYTLTQGVTYTQTIWFETDATVKDLSTVQITWFTNNAGHDYQLAMVQKLGQNSYKVVSTYTWPGKPSNDVRLFDIENLNSAFDLNNTGTYLKFGKLKLEKGSLSTDYSVNPKDILSRGYVQAKIAEQIKANQPDLSGFQKANDVQNAIKNALGKVDVSQTMNDSTRTKLQNMNKELGS